MVRLQPSTAGPICRRVIGVRAVAPFRLTTGSSRATVVAPEPIIIPAARPTGPLVPRLIADGGRATRPGLKVLFMTAYAEKAASKAFLARGMEIITKPIATEAFGKANPRHDRRSLNWRAPSAPSSCCCAVPAAERRCQLGWTDPEGSRSSLGSLLLGYYRDDGKLIYAGRAGTGMTVSELTALLNKLRPLASDKMTVDVPPPKTTRFGTPLVLSRVHWVRPELVAEVTYLTWTADGLLRHVVYEGLREDKSPRDVGRTG